MKRGYALCLLLLFALVACGPDESLRPVVSVLSPVDGARVNMNEPFTIYVASASSHNVSRIELRVDGTLVGTLNNAPPSVSFSSNLRYTAQKPGVLQLTATAIDSRGMSSESVRVQLIIEAPNLGSIGPTPTQPPPPSSGTPAVPAGCQLNSEFVQDVSIPDNTVLRAGEPFVKIWRLKNSSSCDWDRGYQLVFISGERMSALESTAILATRKNEALDVNMAFVAPKNAGNYISRWQLRAPNGQLFGTRFYVTIKVID